MTRWLVVFIGFILAILVKSFFGYYEFLGLLVVGFVVGVMAHEGVLGGIWNAALAGAFGGVVGAILFILLATFGGTALFGVFGGLVGFTISGLSSLVYVILDIVYYVIVMGVAGGVGGFISSKK